MIKAFEYRRVEVQFWDKFPEGQVVKVDGESQVILNQNWPEYLAEAGQNGWELCSELVLVESGMTEGFIATFKREVVKHPLV